MTMTEEIRSDIDCILQKIRDEAEAEREAGNSEMGDVYDTLADNLEAAIRASELE